MWRNIKKSQNIITKNETSIKSPLTNICLKSEHNVTNFDEKTMLIFSKNFDNLLTSLLPPFLRFGLTSVRQFHEKVLNLNYLTVNSNLLLCLKRLY